jgi:hypothetical protein
MHVLTSLDLVIMQVEQGETRNWTDISSNREFLIIITILSSILVSGEHLVELLRKRM